MIRATVAAGLPSLAALFTYAGYDRYGRWRDCFNELGRCRDSESQQVHLEQAGIIWSGLAAICFAGTLLILLWRRPKTSRTRNQRWQRGQ
jgi:hypothetical protein